MQLSDLYGALSNPAKVAHTVVTGDPHKIDLINSVLSFLSYFIRSGVIKKRREYRCSSQQDVLEATEMLEKARSKRPYLFNKRRLSHASSDRDISSLRRDSRVLPSQKLARTTTDTTGIGAAPQRTAERPRISRSSSPLKRTCTIKSDLDALVRKSTEADLKLSAGVALSREVRKSERYEPARDDDGPTKETDEKRLASDKVKIIVGGIGSREGAEERSQPRYPLRCSEKNLDARDIEENLAAGKAEPYLQPDGNADPLKVYFSRPELPLDEGKDSQVLFALGADDKSSVKSPPRPRLGGSCQCSYTFARVPSTSAQLPEGVLRKIIQRNFPESSKSMQPPPGATSGIGARSLGFCLKCNGQGYPGSLDYDSSKQVLETPTNATEVLRTCGSSVGDRNVGMSRSNSLEALMEANSVVELPMPRLVCTSRAS